MNDRLKMTKTPPRITGGVFVVTGVLFDGNGVAANGDLALIECF